METPEQRAALAPQRARKRKAMGVPEPAPAPAYKTTAADRKARAEAKAAWAALMAQLPSELEQNSREFQAHMFPDRLPVSAAEWQKAGKRRVVDPAGRAIVDRRP